MPIDSIESVAKRGVVAVQNYALLSGRAIVNIFQRPHYFADLIVQADSIGIGSVPIVVLTGFSRVACLPCNRLRRWPNLEQPRSRANWSAFP